MPASAHLAGITDTSIQVGHSQVKVIYTLPVDSLKELAERGEPLAGGPKAGEEYQVLTEIVAQGFEVRNDGTVCEPVETSERRLQQVQSHQFSMLYDCNARLSSLSIDYRLFVDDFPDHENFVRIAMGGKYISRVFAAGQHSVLLPVRETLDQWGMTLSNEFVADPNSSFSLEAKPAYFPLGIEHILLGFDHLLFLFALLLLPLAFRQLVTMVTAFTVAHSVTLAMAVFDMVSLPAIWVEAVIALSIVYVGVENLLELKGASPDGQPVQFKTPWKRRVMVTFFFGLIHGFGFSYVLREIGLGDQVASALLFFNLGVEAGQLIAVALVFPLLVWIFRQRQGFVFSRICSVAVILMGGIWLVERLMAAMSI
ncbi:MAG: HupE/UreJ family protein [Ketobacteraceae bacterium]|nr:HupE/UreJ family protein [Ketobacteraceae bacterium]